MIQTTCLHLRRNIEGAWVENNPENELHTQNNIKPLTRNHIREIRRVLSLGTLLTPSKYEEEYLETIYTAPENHNATNTNTSIPVKNQNINAKNNNK